MTNVNIGDVKDKFLVASWFHIELDNPKSTIKGLSDVGGLNVEVEVVTVDMVDAGGVHTTLKRPSTSKYSELSLKRPMSAEKSLYTWVKKIRDGDAAYRTNGAIQLYDITNTAPIGIWTFQNAWPSKWSASDLDVGSNDPMMEELTIVIELLQRTK